MQKTVANWNGSAYVAAVDRKFIYDGWNLIAEYNVLTSFTLAQSFTWGLDLSGTLQGGGGVGGLLAIHDADGVTHLPYYDGNGNIHALVNRSTGAITAAYEYSPFGETLRATGTYAATNNFHFSTKYTDSETGLLYYGFRYYSPSLGRWFGRDPLGERGGLNLYGFANNNGIGRWDYLGLDGRTAEEKSMQGSESPAITLERFVVNGTRPTAEEIHQHDSAQEQQQRQHGVEVFDADQGSNHLGDFDHFAGAAVSTSQTEPGKPEPRNPQPQNPEPNKPEEKKIEPQKPAPNSVTFVAGEAPGGAGTATRGTGTGGLTIKVTQPGTQISANQFESKVQWQVSGNQNGYIIQQVNFRANVTDGKGNLVNAAVPNAQYWEAWKVTDGKVYQGNSSNPMTADTFRVGVPNDTRGTITLTGQVAFIPNYTLNPADNWGRLPSAGSLPATTTVPTGWPPAGGTTPHTMTVIYNNTSSPPRAKITTVP